MSINTPMEKHRYEQLVKGLNITLNKLSTVAEVPISTLRAAIKRKSDITADVALKICKAYPQVSFKWLLDGEGEMLQQAGMIQEPDVPYKAGSPITRAARAFTDIMDIVTTPISALKKKDKALEQKQDDLAREIAELQQKVMQLQQEKDAAEKKGKK